MTRIREEEEDCCRACNVTLSFMDTVIALTYLSESFFEIDNLGSVLSSLSNNGTLQWSALGRLHGNPICTVWEILCQFCTDWLVLIFDCSPNVCWTSFLGYDSHLCQTLLQLLGTFSLQPYSKMRPHSAVSVQSSQISQWEYLYSAKLKTVHTAPWHNCSNKNIFSNCLNWAYDSPDSLRLGCRLSRLWSCCSNGPVSKTAAWPTDNECSSVGRTQLSDTGVGDERTVISQITDVYDTEVWRGRCSVFFWRQSWVLKGLGKCLSVVGWMDDLVWMNHKRNEWVLQQRNVLQEILNMLRVLKPRFFGHMKLRLFGKKT